MLDIGFAASLKKNVILSVFALFVMCCTFLLMIGSTYHEPSPPDTLLGIDNNGENTSSRAAFLSALGYSADASAEQTQEIQIPMEFNDVYNNYNDIQKQSGTDLLNYRGAECMRYTYPVGEDSSGGELLANLIVFQGRIIGGDICTVALDGEMRPLSAKK